MVGQPRSGLTHRLESRLRRDPFINRPQDDPGTGRHRRGRLPVAGDALTGSVAQRPQGPLCRRAHREVPDDHRDPIAALVRRRGREVRLLLALEIGTHRAQRIVEDRSTADEVESPSPYDRTREHGHSPTPAVDRSRQCRLMGLDRPE